MHLFLSKEMLFSGGGTPFYHFNYEHSLFQGLQNPHDVSVDPRGHHVYVGELNPKAVWSLTRQGLPTTPAPTPTPQPTSHLTNTTTVAAVAPGSPTVKPVPRVLDPSAGNDLDDEDL